MPVVGENAPIQIARFIPQEPTKLGEVLHRIQVNSDLIIAGAYRPNDAHYKNGVGVIHIFTAPRKPTFEIESLDALMEGLVKGINGIVMNPTELARDRRNYVMYLGYLSIKETVGRRTEVIDLVEPTDVLKEIGVGRTSVESRTSPSDIVRETVLRVYPHEMIAKQAFPRCGLGGEDLMYGRISREVWRDLQSHLYYKLPYTWGLLDELKGVFGY